jgi:hypothetical protein
MTTWEPGDEVEEGLRALRVHDAPQERVERIRARGVAALAAARPRPQPPRSRLWRDWLEPAFALGLGALYLAEAVTRALAVYR